MLFQAIEVSAHCICYHKTMIDHRETIRNQSIMEARKKTRSLLCRYNCVTGEVGVSGD